MADTHTLRIGRTRTVFTKSETKVAVAQPVLRGRGGFQGIGPKGAARAEMGEPLGDFIIAPKSVVPPIADVFKGPARARGAFGPKVQPTTIPVYHTSEDEVPFVPNGTLLLSFRPGTTSDDIAALLARYDLDMLGPERDGFYTARLRDPAGDGVEVAAALQQVDIVDLAEPDLTTPREMLSFLPNDLLLGREWHLRNTGEIDGNSFGLIKGADARVIDAWELLGHLGNPDAMIAVIDDGFDLSHPDLHGKAVAPFDFIRNQANVQPEPNRDDPRAGDWHGTACAGVAAARAGGGDIVGAAPMAKLIPIRMTRHLSPTEVERWFDYAVNSGAWVISCSWNARARVYPLPTRLHLAITRAATEGRDKAGCVVVFAAGNSGLDVDDPPRSQNGYATHPDVLAIAASTSFDARARYSDTGAAIAVCAPSGGVGGFGIATDDVTGVYTDAKGVEHPMGYADGAYNTNFSGTSSACPLVAGICSLVLSANPSLTAAEVREIIRSTARRIGADSDYVDGHSPLYGHGCVDAAAAVGRAKEALANGDALIALRQATDSRPVA